MQLASVVVFCVFTITLSHGGTLQRIFYDLNNAEELFEAYVKNYNRTYHGPEYKVRLAAFTNSLKRYNQMNSLNAAVYGIDHFSDYTNEEFRNHLGCMVINGATNCTFVDFKPLITPPESLNYTSKNVVTDVKDQGDHCGCSYAFSAVGAIESAHARAIGKLVSFSPQQIIDCDKEQNGCNGGDMALALTYAQGGIESDSDYPYVAREQTCAFDPNKATTHVGSCTILRISNEEDIKSALYGYGPLSIGVDATDLHGYKGGIAQCSFANVNHGVLLVGYGKEGDTPYWIIKNSWNRHWGEKGYLRLQMGSNYCGVTNYVIAVSVRHIIQD